MISGGRLSPGIPFFSANMCPRSSAPKDPGSLFSAAPETPAAKVGHGASDSQERGWGKKIPNKFELLDEYFIIIYGQTSASTRDDSLFLPLVLQLRADHFGGSGILR